ncbi:MAG: hypothetical protein EXR70_08680 [Deltaproteobacteria bacterium]|nr:hypothetical protein [Deltaproteobacteria bacterium]
MLFSIESIFLEIHFQRVRIRCWQICRGLLLSVTFLAFTLLGDVVRTASSASAPAQSSAAQLFAEADEASELIETVRDGTALSPIAEMTGGGGEKWFMVKTRNGNIGWIKTANNDAAKKIDDHFRALPKETMIFAPTPPAGEREAKASATGVITIPVKIIRSKVIVPVTFSNGNSTVIANLAVDTGADQTTISKRIASDLRLHSVGWQQSSGIGGSVAHDVGQIESIKVGEAAVKGLSIAIYDFSRDPNYEGLLGMDFLGRFQMSVDNDKQVLVLAPRGKSAPEGAPAGARNTP